MISTAQRAQNELSSLQHEEVPKMGSYHLKQRRWLLDLRCGRKECERDSCPLVDLCLTMKTVFENHFAFVIVWPLGSEKQL